MDYVKMLFQGRKVVHEAMTQYKLTRSAHEKSSWKSTEFWATMASGLGAVSAQMAGILPAPLGSQIAAASAALYALSRGLAKNSDPLGGVKPGLSTTEVWANALATAGAVLGAAAGALSPETAAILAAISTGAIAVSRGLAKSGAQK